MALENRLSVLTPAERLQLKRLVSGDDLARDALDALERLLSSRAFARVQQRTRDFLVLVLGLKLLGAEERIKQATVAMRVFGEPADFNPLETSRIRVAGAALRERLRDYYEREGRDDAIVIKIPVGTYVPEVVDRRASVLVSAFVNWGPRLDRRLCEAVSDELARALRRHHRLRVTEANHIAGKTPSAFALRGAVETSAAAVRLYVSLFSTQADQVMYSHVFEVARDDALKLATQVADVIVSGIFAARAS